MEGINYHDTYSVVAKMTTVQLLITVVVAQNWHLEQLE